MPRRPISNKPTSSSHRPPAVLCLAAFAVAAHLLTATRYGIFRDELYYLACARHLAWGYVDHPPLIAFVTWAVAHSLGTSLLALRLLPALAAGALVLLAASLARALGGGRFAQTSAALAIIPVPIYLILHHWLTMNAFEPLLWSAVFACVLRMLGCNDNRYWLPIGLLAGIGIENKYSMLLPIAGLLFGLVLTPERHHLRSPWLLAGTALTSLLILPHLLWLLHNHFPFLEFEHNSRASGSRILRGPFAFLSDQAVIMNPLLAPLWIGGLGWLLLSPKARLYRSLGWACLFILLTLVLLQSKNYYVAPLYPLLLAGGAVVLEQITADRCWARIAYVSAIVASGFVLAPLVMPILPPRMFLRYQAALGGLTPVRFERHDGSPLPQYFADEFGWQDMALVTARAYAAIPLAERSSTAIFANDYGEAAAIDYFGPALGLPASIGNNESFWLWGPRGYTGASVLVLGSDGKGDREHFRTVEPAGVVSAPYARADEQFTLFLCHDLHPDLKTAWPQLKAW